MKKNKKSEVKQVLVCVLILYAVFTAVPAAIYFLGGKTETDDYSTETHSLESPEAEVPSELFGKETEESAETEISGETEASDGADSEQPEQIPGFLDNFSLEDTAVQNLAVLNTVTERDIFEIYDISTDTVLSVPAEEFLPAAVICEMPVSAPDEALKAQAVAAYTYYQWQAESGATEGADFTCDTGDWNVYVTAQQLQEHWGEDFEAYYSRIKGITDSVYGQLIMDNGATACSTYFAISNGNTEASQNVWGGELPYLQTVASPGDKLSDGYLSTKQLAGAELSSRLSEAFPERDFDFSSPEGEWIGDQRLSSAGYTDRIDIGGETLAGTEVRTALGLSSASFSVEYGEEGFIFTVYGYGHGVGMSQAGAMFMAQQGYDYIEILSHYYPGTEVF